MQAFVADNGTMHIKDGKVAYWGDVRGGGFPAFEQVDPKKRPTLQHGGGVHFNGMGQFM